MSALYSPLKKQVCRLFSIFFIHVTNYWLFIEKIESIFKWLVTLQHCQRGKLTNHYSFQRMLNCIEGARVEKDAKSSLGVQSWFLNSCKTYTRKMDEMEAETLIVEYDQLLNIFKAQVGPFFIIFCQFTASFASTLFSSRGVKAMKNIRM